MCPMWIHRLAALTIVATCSTALRVNVIPAIDRFLDPQLLDASAALTTHQRKAVVPVNRAFEHAETETCDRHKGRSIQKMLNCDGE